VLLSQWTRASNVQRDPQAITQVRAFASPSFSPPRPHADPFALSRDRSGEWSGPPPPKRNVPTISSLTRELQLERQRHRRSQESVEQLRLEMQMMGRVFASAREKIVALGGESLGLEFNTSPAPSAGSLAPRVTDGGSTGGSGSKDVERLQEELAESRGQCRRLGEQVHQLQQQVSLVSSTKAELLTNLGEVKEYLNTQWGGFDTD